MSKSKTTIRRGRPEDLTDLVELYNHYIETTAITFDIEPHQPAERRSWLEAFAVRGPYQLFVAVGGERVLGYAASGRLRDKAAYRTSVETSVYLRPEATGRGLGPRLYQALFEALADEPVHRAYAAITLPNPASLKLHRRFGFEEVGVFREVGFKLGRYWDVAWLEKPL